MYQSRRRLVVKAVVFGLFAILLPIILLQFTRERRASGAAV
jgi:hypothetical protein